MSTSRSSSRRKPGSMAPTSEPPMSSKIKVLEHWIPACAGMTDAGVAVETLSPVIFSNALRRSAAVQRPRLEGRALEQGQREPEHRRLQRRGSAGQRDPRYADPWRRLASPQRLIGALSLTITKGAQMAGCA